MKYIIQRIILALQFSSKKVPKISRPSRTNRAMSMALSLASSATVTK